MPVQFHPAKTAATDIDRTLIKTRAAQAWQTFTKNEQSLVRFGMFLAEKMTALDQEFAYVQDASRLLAGALMDCAKADGGMRA